MRKLLEFWQTNSYTCCNKSKIKKQAAFSEVNILFFQTPAIVCPHVLVSGGYQKGRGVGLCSEAPRLAGLLPYTEVKELPRSSFLGASSCGRAGGVWRLDIRLPCNRLDTRRVRAPNQWLQGRGARASSVNWTCRYFRRSHNVIRRIHLQFILGLHKHLRSISTREFRACTGGQEIAGGFRDRLQDHIL